MELNTSKANIKIAEYAFYYTCEKNSSAVTYQSTAAFTTASKVESLQKNSRQSHAPLIADERETAKAQANKRYGYGRHDLLYEASFYDHDFGDGDYSRHR
ncbi:unnamed protein product [Toxocara canis]|uniref:Uncharacterized protein n=1 Tax=Toxocara canis TaxID=6265 RepID=A0A183V744_TOXCA|nr:unnamed protein product [Toxocara canis]